MITRLYMAVTADKYELPIAVADSAAELARMLGRAVDTVYGGCNRSLHRTNPETIKPAGTYSARFYRVTFTEEDAE